MKCLKCAKTVQRPRGKTKELQICGACRGNFGGGYSRVKNKITRKDFDRYCLECNVTLPINSHIDRSYCKKCSKLISDRKYISNKKLKRFYDFHKIALIQTPYLTERKRIEVLAR